jgi:hypothetical protein
MKGEIMFNLTENPHKKLWYISMGAKISKVNQSLGPFMNGSEIQ